MSHFFSAPSSAPGRSLSLRAGLYYKPPKQRKQSEDNDEDSHLEDHLPNGARRKPLIALQEDQYQTANLNQAQEVPSAPFPHRPARTHKPRVTDAYIQKQLAELNPPLFVPGTGNIADYSKHLSGKTPTNLKHRHLSVLNTALHKCLSEGDYPRASRIWAQLLRSTVNSKPFDIRRHEDWRIGAEILLQTHPYVDPFAGLQPVARDDDADDDEDDAKTIPHFSDEGYRQAGQYYERLIIQYPIAKASYEVNAQRVNAMAFYPTMFSLWIARIVDIGKGMRYEFSRTQVLSGDTTPIEQSDSEASTTDSHSRAERRHEEKKRLEYQRIKDVQLDEVHKLAERLEQLVISPPTDRDVTILYLRGVVHLWTGDLILRPETDPTMRNDHLRSIGLRKDQIRCAVRHFKEVRRLSGKTCPQLEMLEAEVEDYDFDESI